MQDENLRAAHRPIRPRLYSFGAAVLLAVWCAFLVTPSLATAAAAAAPVVDVSPSSGLVDKQQVVVHATGLKPGDSVVIGQCSAAQVHHGGCLPIASPSSTATADSMGVITSTYTVRRTARDGIEHVDCAAAVGDCVVVVHANGGPLGTAPIGFDDSMTFPPPPTLNLDPAADVSDGSTVHVRGSGFRASASITVVECASEAPNPIYGCPSTSVRHVVADSSGSFTTTTRVVRDLSFPDAPVGKARDTDCGQPPGTCELWAYDDNDDASWAIKPLRFDAKAPPVGLPITVSPADDLVDAQTDETPSTTPTLSLTVTNGSIPQTGADSVADLRPASLLLIAGGMAQMMSAELRYRIARRRR